MVHQQLAVRFTGISADQQPAAVKVCKTLAGWGAIRGEGADPARNDAGIRSDLVWGLGFGVWGLLSRVYGLGCGVEGLGFRV